MLSEISQGTVDWMPNFDGTLIEPKFLSSRLPNVLLNGASGIAVGMATDIPPHNLTDVVKASISLIDNPKMTISDLMSFIPSPDFPTKAEIISSPEEMLEMYSTGRGSVKLRATYEIEEGEIVITALPYQVSTSKILEQIAAQVETKKINMIDDLRDESDEDNPSRIIVVPRSNRIDKAALMSHLFATTDLEKNIRVNINAIGLNGKPQVFDLKKILKEWLKFRTDTVKRRLQNRLDWVNDRLHILEGLLVAYLNLDKVIKIIRTHDKPKKELMKKFKLSEIQANAILDIRLRQLAKLEEEAILSEKNELSQEAKDIEKTLSSTSRLKTLIKKELKEDLEEFGDERNSSLTEAEESKAFDEKELISNDPMTVVLSQRGWIRAAKGHDVDAESLQYREGDGYIAKISDLQTKNKSGKAAINVKGAKPLDPKTIKSIEDSFIVSISSEGKMLLIEATDLPILSKGKGNKIISIDKTKHAAAEDELLHLVVLPKGGSLKLNSGKQHYVIKPNDLNNFVGTRGRKGNFLPKGFRRVDSTEVIVPENN